MGIPRGKLDGSSSVSVSNSPCLRGRHVQGKTLNDPRSARISSRRKKKSSMIMDACPARRIFGPKIGPPHPKVDCAPQEFQARSCRTQDETLIVMELVENRRPSRKDRSPANPSRAGHVIRVARAATLLRGFIGNTFSGMMVASGK